MHFQQKTIIAVACISGAGDTKPVQRVIGLDPCMISKQTKEQEITDLPFKIKLLSHAVNPYLLVTLHILSFCSDEGHWNKIKQKTSGHNNEGSIINPFNMLAKLQHIGNSLKAHDFIM